MSTESDRISAGWSESEFSHLVPPSVVQILGSDGWDAAGFALASIVRDTGGMELHSALWPNIRREFHLLFCTEDPKYAEVREELRASGARAQTIVLAVVTAAVASSLGIAAAAITPFCALSLLALVRLGKEALCAGVRTTQALSADRPAEPALDQPKPESFEER